MNAWANGEPRLPRDAKSQRIIFPIAVAATKLVVSVAVLMTGFRSVSDDVFSRGVIAQDFARSARLDPSGTSWLPLPFWVYGGVMKAVTPALATAQVTAVLLGIGSVLGFYGVARRLLSSDRAALAAGLLGASLPHAAYYGAAMVPDYPTAVLAAAACATAGMSDRRWRLIGSLLAFAATLSRYEIWPIAAVLCGFSLWDAKRDPSTRVWHLTAALVAPSGALLWMLHGQLHHGSPLFFLKRVAAYRRALGASETIDWGTRLVKQPLALLSGEPELALLVVLLVAALALLGGKGSFKGRAWLRPSIGVLSLVLFLAIGDLLDGAPTHHEDRTLLSVWLAMAMLVGELLDRVIFRPVVDPHTTKGTRRALSPRRLAVALAILCTVLGGYLFINPGLPKTQPFGDRSRELSIGRLAAATLPPQARLAIYTEDYGFFAVQAAFGRSGAAAPLMKRDPRQRELDPMSSPDAIARRLVELRARYLIVPAKHQPNLQALSQVIAQTEDFALLEWGETAKQD